MDKKRQYGGTDAVAVSVVANLPTTFLFRKSEKTPASREIPEIRQLVLSHRCCLVVTIAIILVSTLKAIMHTKTLQNITVLPDLMMASKFRRLFFQISYRTCFVLESVSDLQLDGGNKSAHSLGFVLILRCADLSPLFVSHSDVLCVP